MDALTFYTRGMPPSFQPGPFTAEPPSDCVYECVVFDMNRFLGSGSVCQAKYNALFERSAQIEPYQPAGSVTCQLIDRLFEAMEKEPEGYEFVTIGLMWQLFGQIL